MILLVDLSVPLLSVSLNSTKLAPFPFQTLLNFHLQNADKKCHWMSLASHSQHWWQFHTPPTWPHCSYYITYFKDNLVLSFVVIVALQRCFLIIHHINPFLHFCCPSFLIIYSKEGFLLSGYDFLLPSFVLIVVSWLIIWDDVASGV